MAITQFPSGGYNFQAKTPNAVTSYTTSTSYVDAVNITGSGLLTCVYQDAGGTSPSSGHIKIILDGVTILEQLNFTNFDSTPSLNFMHKFNSSLQIQHYTTSGDNVTTIVTYLTN